MRPLGVIVLIVLVDLLGFTIVMPLLGPFAAHYRFSEWQIGLLFSAYPVCQLVSGPILGRLSDRYGRRPLLIFSQAGTALSFLILGLSSDFTVMLLARLLDGASGGNILVAQAYVADVTAPEDRARGMGLIGMAFGLGFVLGPLVGGLLLSLPLDDHLRLRLPFLVAAGFSTVAWILVLTRLPESLPAGQPAREAARVSSLRAIIETLSIPGIGALILIGFLSVAAFAAFEGTFALFLLRRMQWHEGTASFAFAGIGFLSAVVQGGFIRRLVPRWGEARLIVTGLALAACGFAGMALSRSTLGLAGSMTLLGIGQGLVSPSLSGLLSRITPAYRQGAVFGTLSSAQTLARMISYSASNVMLGKVSTGATYWAASGIDVVAAALAGQTATRFTHVRPAAADVAEPQAPEAVGVDLEE
jgi:DHA1 family tetracycline resistance protein-like MFS transporter